MCFIDNEPCTISRSKVRVARKPHKCEECPEQIAPGDAYFYCTGLFEGDWFECFICARCYFVREAIASVERTRGCAEYEAYPPIGNLSGDWSDGDYALELGLFDPNDENAEPPQLWDIGKW
jgi:hypothetical protein